MIINTKVDFDLDGGCIGKCMYLCRYKEGFSFSLTKIWREDRPIMGYFSKNIYKSCQFKMHSFLNYLKSLRIENNITQCDCCYKKLTEWGN